MRSLDGASEDAEVIFKMPKIKQDSPKIAFEKICVKKKRTRKLFSGYLFLIFAILF
jgi:hypothetical protein